MKTEAKNIVFNILGVLSTKGVVLVIGLLNSILLARYLGAVGQGQYAVAITIYTTFFQITNMGLHSAHTYYLSKDKRNLSVVLGNSMAVSVIVAVLTVIIIGILAFLRRKYCGIELYYMIALLIVPVYLFFYLQQQTFLVLDKIKLLNFFDIFAVLIPFLGSIYMIFENKLNINMILGLIALTYFVLDLIGIIFISRINKVMEVSWKFYKKCIKIGVCAAISCFLGFLVLRIDILMVKNMTDDTQTGIYSLAVNLADILNMFCSTCVLVVFPKVNAVKDASERYIIYKKIAKKVLVCMVLITIIAELFIGCLLPLLYGKEYLPAVPVFRILVLGVAFWGMAGIPISYYVTNKDYKMSIIAYIIALILDIIFNNILIPIYGINGAAIASAISYAFVFSYCFIVFVLKEKMEGKLFTNNGSE